MSECKKCDRVSDNSLENDWHFFTYPYNSPYKANKELVRSELRTGTSDGAMISKREMKRKRSFILRSG